MENLAGYETVYVETDGPLAWIVMNRPDKLNAINKQMQADIVAGLDLLRGRDEVAVVILKGAGDRAFCAGADLNEFAGRTPVDRWRYDKAHARRVFEEMERFPKPIISQAHGYAFGGGAELLLASDLRIAAADATIGLTEIRFGMIPGAGGTQRLARLVGEGQAMRLVLTGDTLSGKEAEAIGLVEMAPPRAELEETVATLALRIAGRAPIAVQAAKEAVRAAARSTLDGGLMHEIGLSCLCFGTEDKDEAIAAFFENREPAFKGR